MPGLLRNTGDDLPLDDPTALARFGKLDLVARLLVEGFMVGKHQSPNKGESVEFVEHRQYAPGDEIRHIDWRAYGKTGKYYVKEFEEETNLRCYLLLDASGSMRFGRRTLSKFDYARSLAAALGYLLLLQRDAAGLITFDTKIRDHLEPSAHAQNYQRAVDVLEKRTPGGETSLGRVLEQLLPAIKRRSLIVILSDCFDSLKSLSRALRRLRHARHEVIVLQIVAPEEEDFPFSGPTEFRSLEKSHEHASVDPHQMRAHYLEQYATFCGDLARQCRNVGIEHEKLVTTRPYQEALGAFLHARRNRKK